MNFCFLSGCPGSDFLAGNCSSALAEFLLSVVEEMTFYSADMSFPPTPLLSGTQPLTAATIETQFGIKCHPGAFGKKGFKLSTAVTSVTLVRGVSLGQRTRNTFEIIFHTLIFVPIVYFAFIQGVVVYDSSLFI